VAYFIGNSSLNRIRASGGTLGGEGLAKAGRILGIIGTVFLVLFVIVGAAQRFSGRLLPPGARAHSVFPRVVVTVEVARQVARSR
jgi:hypothetical protein